MNLMRVNCPTCRSVAFAASCAACIRATDRADCSSCAAAKLRSDASSPSNSASSLPAPPTSTDQQRSAQQFSQLFYQLSQQSSLSAAHQLAAAAI